MTDKRDQGPHYIPDLDPEHTGADPGGRMARMFWLVIILGAAALGASGLLFWAGFAGTATVMLIVGVSLILLLFVL